MTNTDLSARRRRPCRSTVPAVLGVTALVATGAVAFGVSTAREYRISGEAVVGAVRVAMPSVPTSDRTVSVRTVTGAIDVVSR
jgi:hypothetical protein